MKEIMLWLPAILLPLMGTADAQVGSRTGGNYLVIYERRYSPGATYNIYIQMLRHINYQQIEAELFYKNYTRVIGAMGEMTTKTNNITVANGSLTLSSGKREGTLQIQIPAEATSGPAPYLARRGQHFFRIKGSGSVKFANESDHITRDYDTSGSRNETVFIHTDKAVYKTGQKVRYRVFVLDRALKPVDKELDIYIKDSEQNRIKEHNNVRGIYGFTGHIQLADHPILGRWTIYAKLKGSESENERPFEVQEYVLPTYDVKLDLPAMGTDSNAELKGTVKAKYTYGEPVKGHVTLRVRKGYSYTKLYEPKAIQTEFEIDGEADFSIGSETLKKLDAKYDNLVVEANVTERETGEVRLVQERITMHREFTTVQFQYTGSDVFKPGMKYKTFAMVSQSDGRPSIITSESMKVSITYFTDQESNIPARIRPPNSPTSKLVTFLSPFPGGKVLFMPDMHLSVPRDGMVKIELDIPEDVATAHIGISFKNKGATKNIRRYVGTTDTYLNLEMKSSYVKVGDQAEFYVTSNIRPNSKVTYHIIHNSKILETGYTSINSAFRMSTFFVTMTTEMASESKILAYIYMPQSDEFVVDGLTFTVDMTLKNDVSLRFDRAQVSPGTNVSLHVNADVGSMVFVKAVDKRVLLQKGFNLQSTAFDITQDTVFRQTGIFKPWNIWKFQGNYMYEKLGGKDALSMINQAGVNAMTDGELDYKFLKGESLIYAYGRSASNAMTYDMMSEAAGGMGGVSAGSYKTTIREDFPELWIWTNETVSSTGRVDVEAEVPDTITDWVATAYALNKDTGIGVAPVAANLTAYLPFYVDLHLPFSVVSDEVAVIQALVYNYYPHDMYVTVTLRNSSADFVGLVVNSLGQEEEEMGDLEKCILVKSDDVHSAYFAIKPHKIGTLKLEVEAESTRGKDTIRRQLKVRPPGIQQHENIAHMISLTNNGSFEIDVPVMYPPRIVPGSQRVQVTVIGDIFGPSLDHLDRLIQMPYGCGEQNMVRFAPAVYAAAYLNVTNRFTDQIRNRVTNIMETGFQRQMNYKRSDGSFSAFGRSDSNGSLWLTAFVLKSFAQASVFTYIDPGVVEQGVMFLLDNQNDDGSFNSTGFVHNTQMQGGSASTSKSLAAYVLISLIEISEKEIVSNETVKSQLRQSILRAWTYLSKGTASMTDDYEMAITAYALSLMGRGGETELLRRLETSRNIRNRDGEMYWHHPIKSMEVEQAAYVLLTYARKHDQASGLPILRWLVKQRTPYGGYHSTQDTVVAMQGLAEIATSMYSTDVNMTIEIDDTINTKKAFTLDRENMDVLQLIEIPPEARYVRVEAVGRGLALVEVSIFYNTLTEETTPSFELRLSTNASTVNAFTLKACARRLGHGESGMVLISIDFPSGYDPIPIFDQYSKQSENYARPNRIEMDRGNLVLYYNELTETQCYRVDAVRKTTVGKSQPAGVKVFSYYDTEKSATKFYLPNVLKKSSICDFCGIECGCGYDPEAVPKERCLYSTAFLTRQPARINRIIQPIEEFQTIRQRLQPNQWRRGQTIPVSFSSGRSVSFGKPRWSLDRETRRWRTVTSG